jgi:hypothetical protein
MPMVVSRARCRAARAQACPAAEDEGENRERSHEVASFA